MLSVGGQDIINCQQNGSFQWIKAGTKIAFHYYLSRPLASHNPMTTGTTAFPSITSHNMNLHAHRLAVATRRFGVCLSVASSRWQKVVNTRKLSFASLRTAFGQRGALRILSDQCCRGSFGVKRYKSHEHNSVFRIILQVSGDLPTWTNRYVNPLADWILPSGGKQNGMGGSRAVSRTKAGGNGSVRNCMVSSVKLRHTVFEQLFDIIALSEENVCTGRRCQDTVCFDNNN